MNITPFNTVKELRDFLSTFPDDTPLTAAYDGTGRVHGVASYESDVIACVAVFPASNAWLEGNGHPLNNPLVTEGI